MSAARRNRALAGPNRSKISNTHLFRGTKITKPGKIPCALEKGVQTSQPAVIAHERYKLEEQTTLPITDAHIKRYWKARESERLMYTIHQGDLDDQTKILYDVEDVSLFITYRILTLIPRRLFDITSQYGPCIGISRSKRWARANRLRLSPPIEVLAILSKHQGSQNTDNNERAYVDELLS
ncbi:DNA polymerase delta subunit 4 [Golovinomyces cichoracearum]|uniref:DNA polymerase delta subunit 4 n=1 Tax=Golovinomyces cichoracearum TaxID=62708 RepID=A0A420J5H2_9PEZI|nr:DNA polymerase delta subunit 4 [Golovinomyces cichoracearum]